MREPNADTPQSDSCQTPLPAVPSVDSICADLESRLRAGESIRCEFYLSRHAWLANDLESAMDLIFTEYEVRRELCESPNPSEYFDRFPKWQKKLDQQFELGRLFDEQVNSESSTLSNPNLLDRSKSRFKITALLARGGIGQVMRALDTELNREVAVRQIHSQYLDDPRFLDRYWAEAQLLASVQREKGIHEQAVRELEEAERELSQKLGDLSAHPAPPAPSPRA